MCAKKPSSTGVMMVTLDRVRALMDLSKCGRAGGYGVRTGVRKRTRRLGEGGKGKGGEGRLMSNEVKGEADE